MRFALVDLHGARAEEILGDLAPPGKLVPVLAGFILRLAPVGQHSSRDRAEGGMGGISAMKVGLFIPCYIDAFFPEVGIATLELLERLGCSVEYPLGQTCCGQPMANSG